MRHRLPFRHLGRDEERRHGGTGASNRRQDVGGETLLRQFAAAGREATGTRDPQSLGDREPSALVSGHDLRRGCMPCAQGSRAGKPEHRAKDRDEPVALEPVEEVTAEEALARLH